ncbi:MULTISPECIES: hypothetical protein [Halomonadaceae]|uniref:Uncharacterized protein n=1 Tax=Vreelandella halophila TaxID=86177 RepID=A0A9X4YHP6_9GAMM|nr:MULTISPECIES: hypothetical protein [Halomonas]MYL28145.1 hypothetical protein [Halomonas utahensis]MYL76052.1 hypothetical protein [Halomonas sp. 22501_18_FS]
MTHNATTLSGLPVNTTEIRYENEDYRVMADGRIEYTQKGIPDISEILHEHESDIRLIQTPEQHREALEICIEEGLAQTAHRARSGDLDAQLLHLMMSDASNEEVKRMRDLVARKAAIKLVN